jgi:hypothetical protein
MRERLEALSLHELREIAGQVGIEFDGGNDAIIDKEEFILVLDEADKKDLQRAYQQIVSNIHE